MDDRLKSEETDFRSELAAANINPDSCLATDYLNHFNEIVMLLEMAIDMPDLMDEAASWQPTTYVEHFEGSGFAARDLVIKAYGLAQPRVRTRFEGVISRLDELILSILNMLSQAGQANGAFDSHTRYVFSKGQAEVQRHLSMLNGIIHNLSDDSGPGEHEPSEDSAAGGSDAQSQDEIDQLFD